MTNTLHAVFAITADGNRYRISRDDMSYDSALEMYARLDARLGNTADPCRINGSQVQWFNVRAMDDSGWNESPKAIPTWGYVLADDGVNAVFTDRVTEAAKAIKSESMRGTLLNAAVSGTISYHTHAKTREGLANRRLTAGQWYYELTELGKAVAHRIFREVRGVTVDEYQQQEANKRRAVTIKRAARVRGYKSRIAPLEPKLAGLTFNGKPAVDALKADSYGGPLHPSNPKCEDGKVTMTVAELEALVNRLTN